jgi:hypothetical protein
MKFMNEIRQHFSIRKLSVGAASVLIGLSFLGWNAQTVKADEVTSAKDQTTEVATAGDAAETKDATAPVVKEKAKASDQEVKQNEVATKPVAGQKDAEQTAGEKKAEQPASGAETKSVEVPKKTDEGTAGDAEKPVALNSKETKTDDTDASDADKQTLDVEKKTPVSRDAAKAEKVPAPRETTPSWSLDDWDVSKSADNKDLTLKNYKGTSTDVYVPNAADIKEKDPSTEITQVHINRGAIDSISNKASNIVVSNKDGQKVKFDGDNLSSAFA